MLNRKSHLTSVFNDYLIFDDHSEYFKRKYTLEESNSLIKELSQFKVYPNYGIHDQLGDKLKFKLDKTARRRFILDLNEKERNRLGQYSYMGN